MVTADYDTNRDQHWHQKARENILTWGFQDPETLLLAMMEELGELSQAMLEAQHEDADPKRVQDELDDLAALMYQFQWQLDGLDERAGEQYRERERE